MRLWKAESVSQQTGKLGDHLRGQFGLLAYDQRGDGVEGIKQEMRLQLVTKGLQLSLTCGRFRRHESTPLLLNGAVVLDAEVERAPGNQHNGGFKCFSGHQTPAQRYLGVLSMERHQSRYDGAAHSQKVRENNGDDQCGS